MLDTIAELSQDTIGNIHRVLSHEINSYAFGADKPRYLLDFFNQGFGGVIKKKMGLIKKEDHFWLIGITYFGEFFEEFRE